MAGARFVTTREVFEAFPGLVDDLRAAPIDAAPLAYVGELRRSDTPEDAVSFLAYLLGRREAVWWAAQSVRLLARIPAGGEDAPLRAAEEWVRDPDDGRRREALRLAASGNRRLATTWVALAAGWSGGNIAPSPPAVVPATPEMTPKAVRTAILVALATVTARERLGRLQACIDAGLPLTGLAPTGPDAARRDAPAPRA